MRKASGEEGRYIEIEGTADLVVECVSNSSEQKDEQRLLQAYERAGVTEYWIIDARGDQIQFALWLLGPRGYEPAPEDGNGFRRSSVLGSAARLLRSRRAAGLQLFKLEVR